MYVSNIRRKIRLGNQRSRISLSRTWLNTLEEFYVDNKEVLGELDINSVSRLVEVMAKFGKPELEILVKRVADDLKCERSLMEEKKSEAR